MGPMKPKWKFGCAVAALALASGLASARPQGDGSPTVETHSAADSLLFVHTDGPRLVNQFGEPLLLKGTNLGNWLEPEGYMFVFDKGPQSTSEIEELVSELYGPEASGRFWKEWHESYITRDDIELIRRAGFNSVRIPLHWELFQDPNGEGFQLLDRVIAWCREAHIWVVLDLHCAPGGQTGANIDDSLGYPWLFRSKAMQDLTAEIWKGIARHYRDDATVIGYDLLNEPIPHFDALKPLKKELEPVYKRIAAAIREVDPNHVLILGGAVWDTDFSVFSAPFDKNVMYTFHKYWMTPDQSSIQEYVDFRARYKVPIWLGESGENTDDWVRQFRVLLEKNDIGWCFWPYKKMERTSAVVTIAKPTYWDEIVAFGQLPRGTANAEKRVAARPAPEHVDQAFRELLENIRAAKCRVNEGYVKALGMHAP